MDDKNFKGIKKSLYFRTYIQLFLLPETFARTIRIGLYIIEAINKSLTSKQKNPTKENFLTE